jgi:hypothetical protein
LNIFNEITHLNFAQKPKISLFSYFTLNEKVKSNAESALVFCKNDEEKLAYLNKILIEMPHLIETESINGL